MVWTWTNDGSNEAVLTASGENSFDFAYLNALTLTAIPEPGSFALLGLTGLLAMRRRRRRTA